MTRRACVAAMAILVLLFSEGCLFEPRKAEQPGQGDGRQMDRAQYFQGCVQQS